MMNQVVAYSPNQVHVAQKTVRSWCAENIRRLLVQKREAQQNIAHAQSGKFSQKPFKKVLVRVEKRITYFKKIGAAIKLGYMIVPNFDMDLIAVRTTQKKPRKELGSKWWTFEQQGQRLPQGEGRYVDARPFRDTEVRYEENHKGEEVERTYWYPSAFDEEIDFPMELVHPTVLAQTQQALGYKLFDQIGVARNQMIRSGDPIVMGRILDPTRTQRAVTFFIAWWFDESML